MRRQRSLRAAVLAGVLAGTTLAGQAAAGVVSPAGPAGAAAPSPGGTLTFGQVAGITSLDPVHINGGGTSGGNEGGAIYGYLMRYDMQAKKYVPYLAKSLTSSDDFTTWTLQLRPGMTFSDGTPFDAQAVVENIERDKSTPSVAETSLALVSSATATNPTTVTFTLKQPWSGFGYEMSWVPGLIAAPSYLAQVSAGNANATPIGAGPFEVESFQPGTSLTLQPNPHYALAKPKLSTLKFTFIPGGPSTLQAFQAGQLDAALLIDAPSVKMAQQAGIPALVTTSDIEGEVMMNNRSTSPLANPKLREAITLAFNPKVFDERVDAGVPLASNLFFPKGSAWYTPGEPKIPYDPKEAAQLVKEVEQETGWNGTLRLISDNTTPEFPLAIEAMLQPIGINLQVTDNVPLTTLELDVIIKHDFDLAQFGISAFDPQPFYSLWSNFVSPTNFAGYSDPAMTSAVDALGAAATPAARKAAVKHFLSAFLSTHPVVDVGIGVWRTIHKPGVHGLYQTIGGATLFDRATVS